LGLGASPLNLAETLPELPELEEEEEDLPLETGYEHISFE
jgi:hypothetical protein